MSRTPTFAESAAPKFPTADVIAQNVAVGFQMIPYTAQIAALSQSPVTLLKTGSQRTSKATVHPFPSSPIKTGSLP